MEHINQRMRARRTLQQQEHSRASSAREPAASSSDSVEGLYFRAAARAVLAGALVLLLVGVLALVAWQYAPTQVFAAARAHWDSSPIPRYRLVIARPSLNCQQDVEVHNERIVRVFEHNCPIEMLTMTDLFDRIAWLDGLESFGMFTPNACACESRLNATVAYEERLGYRLPSKVGIADQRVVAWGERVCWQHMLTHGKLPECDIPFLSGQPRITTISLTPLPE
jgi:hypothetical protein